jgi:hypothetical protein
MPPKLTILILTLSLATAPAADRALVARWLENGQRVEGFHASFTQERFLRTVQRPLTRNGQLWYARGGKLRWELESRSGETEILAISAGDERLWLLWPAKQEARQLADEELAEAGLLAFFQQGIGQDPAAFDENFHLLSVREHAGGPEIRVRPRDRKAATAVKEITFSLSPEADGLLLRKVSVELRSGTRLDTTLTDIDPTIPPSSRFIPPLEGYQILD